VSHHNPRSAGKANNTLVWGIRKSVLFGTPDNFQLVPALTSLNRDLYQRMIDLLVASRHDAGLTQVDLGRMIDQRQTFISKIETGERRLDPAEFVEISRAIGVDPYALMRSAEDNNE
jgi:ribosome-binding protein aMBF1 (putative translation factor)